MSNKETALGLFDRFRSVEAQMLRKLAYARDAMEELEVVKAEVNQDPDVKAAFSDLAIAAGRTKTAMMRVPTDLAIVVAAAEDKFPKLIPPEPEPEEEVAGPDPSE